ncbi:hypothetical protein Kisp01_14660 [Kineosporia sp. NBRC 101677]|nr:hypothetical protein Kisp01_14660 [Kineosporia sp. NBRC 101677]
MAKAERLLAEVPTLVPVYAHRYLPTGSGTSGHSVLSVHWLSDTVVYGIDLEDYVVREFQEPSEVVPFWRDWL